MMPALNIKLQIGISGWIATWAWYATCGSEGPCLRPQRKTAGTCWRISPPVPGFQSVGRAPGKAGWSDPSLDATDSDCDLLLTRATIAVTLPVLTVPGLRPKYSRRGLDTLPW